MIAPVRWLLTGRLLCPSIDSAVQLSDQRMTGYPSQNPDAMRRQRDHVLGVLRRDRVLGDIYRERELVLELELRRESRRPGRRVLPVRLPIAVGAGLTLEDRINGAIKDAATAHLP